MAGSDLVDQNSLSGAFPTSHLGPKGACLLLELLGVDCGLRCSLIARDISPII